MKSICQFKSVIDSNLDLTIIIIPNITKIAPQTNAPKREGGKNTLLNNSRRAEKREKSNFLKFDSIAKSPITIKKNPKVFKAGLLF